MTSRRPISPEWRLRQANALPAGETVGPNRFDYALELFPEMTVPRARFLLAWLPPEDQYSRAQALSVLADDDCPVDEQIMAAAQLRRLSALLAELQRFTPDCTVDDTRVHERRLRADWDDPPPLVPRSTPGIPVAAPRAPGRVPAARAL